MIRFLSALFASFVFALVLVLGQTQGFASERASALSIIESAKKGAVEGEDRDPIQNPDQVQEQNNEQGGGWRKEEDSMPARSVEVEDFVAFVYSPGPRDPFISPQASGTIVIEKRVTEDISLESLMAFAEKLRDDLGDRVEVLGVSVPPGGENSYALIRYADGKDGGGKIIMSAMPPRTITVESGIPVRYPPEETAFISRLAQLVAQNSPLRLKRDSRTEAVIFPIERIDERGVQVSLPGYEEPILLPVSRKIETFTGSGD
jgi:hypothetical protein